MTQTELTPDQKGQASLTLGEVIRQTRDNFPDPRFRPRIHLETDQYHLYGIDPSPYEVWVTADGIGTKPELAERLAEDQQDPEYFKSLAFDTFAMIDGDEARFGRFLLGIANIVDVNTATPKVIAALAQGAQEACNDGHFALLNGETAELGYRVSGYGKTRLNWNAVGLSLVVPNKLIIGEQLAPGQPIVALREKSIRSNGLSKARTILEETCLRGWGYRNKREYFIEAIEQHLIDEGSISKDTNLDPYSLTDFLDEILGHDVLEQVLVPWHEVHPRVARELLMPSTLYGKLIYAAQGGVDSARAVNMIAAAHITGGGVPEKVKRMVQPKGLGAHLDTVFPDPAAVQFLLELAQDLPEKDGKKIIDDRMACEQWNRGVGFVVATKTNIDALLLVNMANQLNYEAAIAGEILEEPKIEWRGHTWNYQP